MMMKKPTINYPNAPYSLRRGVDIAAEHALCESNYRALRRLMPNMDCEDERRLRVSLPGSEHSYKLVLTVVERCKFSSFVELRADYPILQGQADVLIRVAMYHDVRMTEVVYFNGYRRLQLYLGNTSDTTRGQDEKQQANLFLAEWMQNCLQFAYVETALIVDKTARNVTN